MAISPQEAFALTPGISSLVDEFEKKIDAYLCYRCTEIGGGTREFATPDMPRVALEELMRRYQEAGWTVTEECDQRYGPFLRFVAR